MVDIRDFREGDAPAVREMMQRLAEQRKESAHRMVLKQEFARFFPGYLQSFLTDRDSVMKVAEADRKVVGYAIATRGREAPFFKHGLSAHLSDVYVEETHRGHGVAKQLLAAVESWARANQLHAIEVDVIPDHVEEIRALEGLGFEAHRVKFLKPLDPAAGVEAKSAPPTSPRSGAGSRRP